METIFIQFLGGIAGGSVSGKIFHFSDAGAAINALTGALGGVAGGQLLNRVLGNTKVDPGLDIAAIIGPFLDGALAGAFIQIAACVVLNRLSIHD